MKSLEAALLYFQKRQHPEMISVIHNPTLSDLQRDEIISNDTFRCTFTGIMHLEHLELVLCWFRKAFPSVCAVRFACSSRCVVLLPSNLFECHVNSESVDMVVQHVVATMYQSLFLTLETRAFVFLKIF